MKLLFYLSIFLASFITCFYSIDKDTSYIFYGLVIMAIYWVIYQSVDWLKVYLRMSDCDGMCNHCNEKLKEVCKQYKS
jgi:hypothetical protein